MHLHAFPDGRAYPCCFSFDKYPVGDLNKHSMKEVFNGEKMKQMRTNMLEGKKCKECEIDGLIVPDLPVDIYYEHYHDLFKNHNLQNMFLITPQTSEKRIRFIDKISDGFIYMVSSYSTTGAQKIFGDETIKYFKRINQMKLKSPLLVGFGISNKETRRVASINSNGVIIGSAYINMLTKYGIKQTKKFINKLKIN